jgi:hypothetical protein
MCVELYTFLVRCRQHDICSCPQYLRNLLNAQDRDGPDIVCIAVLHEQTHADGAAMVGSQVQSGAHSCCLSLQGQSGKSDSNKPLLASDLRIRSGTIEQCPDVRQHEHRK